MARLLALLCALTLGACATPKAEVAPVCDGRHLRPANPYGSVLITKADAASPSPAAPSPPPPAAPVDPKSYGRCGA